MQLQYKIMIIPYFSYDCYTTKYLSTIHFTALFEINALLYDILDTIMVTGQYDRFLHLLVLVDIGHLSVNIRYSLFYIFLLFLHLD